MYSHCLQNILHMPNKFQGHPQSLHMIRMCTTEKHSSKKMLQILLLLSLQAQITHPNAPYKNKNL